MLESYDVSKLDIFSIENLKRGELSTLHSILVYLYSKIGNTETITLKYSEISWSNSDLVSKTINKLHEMGIVEVIQKPTKQSPTIIKLKNNMEVNYILNKNKKIDFENCFENKFLSEDNFKKAINCNNLNEHFQLKTIKDWIRNVNNGLWNCYRLFLLTKILTYSTTIDYKVKTFIVNKYMAKSNLNNFFNAIEMIFDKIPDNRKDILYNQFKNALKTQKIKSNGTFIDMTKKYLEGIKNRGSFAPPQEQEKSLISTVERTESGQCF